MRACLVVVLALGACVQDQLVPCGTLLCPVDRVCHLGASCVTPEQLATCAEVDNGTTCDAVINGYCVDGACRSAICGDGFVVAPAEVCDHGNQPSLTCSADCRSDLTCGNGIADFATGEECDRGVPGLSGDGCSSTCKIEVGLWRDVTMTGHGETHHSEMVFDRARQRLVMVSHSYREIDHLETWEWIDGSMNRRDTMTAPPEGGFQLSYDSDRECIVLVLDDGHTWEWDDVRWTERATPVTPMMSDFALAYDESAHRTILFGEGQTWAWDGSTWSQLSPATSPPVTATSVAMAYDPDRKRIVMFSGTQTYLWDGTTWTQATDLPFVPPLRRSQPLTWDSAAHTVVMFGGVRGTGSTDPDLWRWNGTTWSKTAIANTPARWGHAMAYDEGRDALVVFGGDDDLYTSGGLTDEWLLKNGSWSRVFPEAMPRSPGTLVYDTARARSVLIGTGAYGIGLEAWWWNGSVWHLLAVLDGSSGPSAAAYDEARDRIVIFHDDRHVELDGAIATDLPPLWLPPTAGPLVYDPVRRVTDHLMAGTTLSWDGATWASSPNPFTLASGATAAFDRRRGVLVAHVPGATAELPGTLWEQIGATWTANPVVPPPTRSGRMTYDGVRGVIVLADDFTTGKVYDWDGATWTEVDSQVGVPPASSRALAFDGARRELVFHGGSNTDSYTKSTWVFRNESRSHETCDADVDADGDALRGCADPDCWASCTPTCPPATTCLASDPRCGDGTCAGPETYVNCPADCL